jgi:1-acyl-sn-glycerol-3-phosphate acyltransferase
MRNCNTLPLSSNPKTMRKFIDGVRTHLDEGDLVLIYPEQSMWWNYRKPKPLKEGAYYFALKSNVPVLPMFITMQDSCIVGEDGFPVQEYTIHVLPAIYPDNSLPRAEAKEKMRKANYDAWVRVYEDFYKIPLVYGE